MASKLRKHTPQFKAQVVLAMLTGAKTPTEICRESQLHLSVVSRWKAEFLERAHQVFQTPEEKSEQQQRIAELERLLGQLTVKLEVAKKASNLLTL